MKKLLVPTILGAAAAYLADRDRREAVRKQVTGLLESSDDVVARITRQRDEAVAAAQEEMRANRAQAAAGG